MLSPYRVLDLTDERGELTGMLLADLGADVIRVEPASGSPARRACPRLSDGESLQFLAYNRGKRSVALDLAHSADRETFLALTATADFVLESGPGGALAEAGIGFDELRRARPKIVHVLITPFGLDGPRAQAPASDLTIAALGGPMSLQGPRERSPVRVSVPQVWRHTGAEAVAAALVAHARMRTTGEAQQVDVSAQSVMTWTMLNAMTAAAIHRDFERQGSDLQLGISTVRLVYPSADGHVIALPHGPTVEKLLPWLRAERLIDERWDKEEWATWNARMANDEAEVSRAEVEETLGRLLSRYAKSDLLERGLEEGVTIAPVNTVADLLAFEHLEDRDYWRQATLPGGETVRAPGAFARLGDAPLRVDWRAPRVDEHGAAIRAELAARKDRSRPELDRASGGGGGEGGLPFSGLKVADFSWIGVGPITAKYLADHGATVVRVESESRPDNLRGAGPFKDGVPGWNRSHFFGEFNTSKLGLALDLKHPEAIEVARTLIDWSDVFIESFTPGAVDRLGLGWNAVQRDHPDLVMVSTCLMGQTGRAAHMAGYGYHAGAVAGFYEVTGWPDRPPDGPWMAYTDTIAPRFLSSTLMAALDHARRTGRGQHIDASQLEMALHFLAPEILEFQSSGHLASRIANRSRFAAPQGVYPCRGDDEWCAIAIDDDEQWRSLRKLLGEPVWAQDAGLDSIEGRIAAHDALDRELAAWTSERDAEDAMQALLAAGVPAGRVLRSSDLLEDPQLAHRRFHRTHDHAEMGPVPYSGHAFRIRGYESGPRSAAPALGEHSFEVLTELLGVSEDRVAELLAAGAIG